MKWLALVIILLHLAPVASAQPYHIRVTSTVRLRASHSLDSPVVVKALAGDVLQVVGRFNRWLKIDRDGMTAWLADWVNYTRLNGQQASPAAAAANQQQQSNIDNCCFVNRQCATNQEWEAGYWAFQENECPLSQAATIGTTSASPPTDQAIDNCCFVNRQCTTQQDWVDGYEAYRYNNSCEPNAPVSSAVGSHPGIHIDGSDRFRAQVQAALDLIRQRSGRWYHYLISGLDRVQQIHSGERYVDVYQRTYYLTDNVAFLWGEFQTDASLTWLAGVLVHEACHVYARQHGLTYSNEYERFREEVICQQIQIEALDEIDQPDNRWRQYLSGLINNWKAEGHEIPRSIIDELKHYPR